MTYRLFRRSKNDLPKELDEDCKTVDAIMRLYDDARTLFDEPDLGIECDGDEITLAELNNVKHEIAEDIALCSLLSSGVSRWRGGQPDIADSVVGPIAVPKPINPEDRFK